MEKKKNITILIADDDSEDQFLFKRAIQEFDSSIVIDHAYNGAELVDTLMKKDIFSKMRDINPNIILTDLHMPSMNGFEMIKKVRDPSKFDDIPIYVFSSSLTEEMKQQVSDLGAQAMYKKPHTFIDLKKLIGKILKDEGLNN